jgi:Fic family protein
MYIWELADWPHFSWDRDRLTLALAEVHLKQGRLLGRMERLGFELQSRVELEAVSDEALKSSEIEGELLDLVSVRSSVARHLEIPGIAPRPADRRVDGIVELTLDATRNSAAQVTRERLFRWQAALFPHGRSGLRIVRIANWRDESSGPMQVVSGPHGRQRVHYEAPPASRLGSEMENFLAWLNRAHKLDGVVHAAIAHLWFVTIHPFEDGNGRIARALADLSLARTENSPQRFYSLSAQIGREREDYYDSLERAQKGDLDLSAYLLWFIGCLSRALDHAEETSAGVLRKADFWQRHAQVDLNQRQRTVLNRFLDGFEGKLTARKWMALAKCSAATAQRDIAELIERGLLIRNPGGSKNSSYSLAEPKPEGVTISTSR